MPRDKIVEEDYKAIVKFLVNHSDVIDKLLERAIDENDLEMAELLLKCGANIDMMPVSLDNDKILHKLCKEGNINMIQLLLEHGANVNVKGKYEQTPIYRAIKEGHKDIVQLLLSHGADINMADDDDELTPFDCALRENKKDIAELLLEHGFDINYKDSSGATQLIYASKYGFIDMIRFLLKYV